MTLEDLEKSKPAKLTIAQAAEIMGVTPMFLRLALRQGMFEFGTAVKGNRWIYYINTERFLKYMKAEDMSKAKRDEK